MRRFPQDLQDFGNVFVTAQIKRHRADYDPAYRVTRSEVKADIATAEDALKKLKAADLKDRRALAAWVIFSNRR